MSVIHRARFKQYMSWETQNDKHVNGSEESYVHVAKLGKNNWEKKKKLDKKNILKKFVKNQ